MKGRTTSRGGVSGLALLACLAAYPALSAKEWKDWPPRALEDVEFVDRFALFDLDPATLPAERRLLLETDAEEWYFLPAWENLFDVQKEDPEACTPSPEDRREYRRYSPFVVHDNRRGSWRWLGLSEFARWIMEVVRDPHEPAVYWARVLSSRPGSGPRLTFEQRFDFLIANLGGGGFLRIDLARRGIWYYGCPITKFCNAHRIEFLPDIIVLGGHVEAGPDSHDSTASIDRRTLALAKAKDPKGRGKRRKGEANPGHLFTSKFVPPAFNRVGVGVDGIGIEISGLKEGPWLETYWTGWPRAYGVYHQGKRVGPWLFFHESGNPAAAGEYKEGRKYGPWTYASTWGRPASELVSMRDGLEHGLFISIGWFGRPMRKGFFEGGRKEGPSRDPYSDINLERYHQGFREVPLSSWLVGGAHDSRHCRTGEYPMGQVRLGCGLKSVSLEKLEEGTATCLKLGPVFPPWRDLELPIRVLFGPDGHMKNLGLPLSDLHGTAGVCLHWTLYALDLGYCRVDCQPFYLTLDPVP